MSTCHCLLLSGICRSDPPPPKSKKPQRGTRPDAGPPPDLPVVIGRPVGQGGVNIPRDFVQVQRALNHVLPDLARADPCLADDGLVGPVTLGAIKKFQERNFGWFDQRVDPAGKTLAKINNFLATQPNPGGPQPHRGKKRGRESLIGQGA
ncbi:MAG TPA: hypothetical protein VKE40_03725 [Gemmataceae bacterium]|nr:hypothetical protein [Gemmataceae bacterium]